MGTIIKRLAILAADNMAALVDHIKRTGLPKATKQKEKARFKANRITHWNIDWAMPATLIDQRIRALNPYYLANTVLGSIPITISSGTSSQTSIKSPPGEVIAIDTAGVIVSTGEGVYCITALSFASQETG